MVKESCYNDDEFDYKHTYKYDRKRNLIESNRYDSDVSLKVKISYKYDQKGNVIELIKYSNEYLSPFYIISITYEYY